MKTKLIKYFFILIILINLFGNKIKADDLNTDIISFLDNYFANKDYCILGEKLIIDNKKFIIAVRYTGLELNKENNEKKKIIDKGIIFTIEDNKIIVHLYILKNKILRKNKENFLKYEYYSKDFDGYYIYIMNKERDWKGIHLYLYWNKGKSVSEGFTILWDYEKKQFYEFLL